MFLEKIIGPNDVKKLSLNDIGRLCAEIRWAIIKTVSGNGGHLASNLGSVELTVALLRALDLEKKGDEIIWDVGHQTYAYKLLTGRYGRFPTLRTFNGLSGYLKRNESPYDVFGAGHSSTSISAALGILEAKRMRGETGNVTAVIGDGALTSGIAYEALNNAGSSKNDILIILNTNEMSISKNTGAIAHHLSKLISDPIYNKILFKILEALRPYKKKGNIFVNAFFRFLETVKILLVPGKIFESFNIRYFGPIDGHDVKLVENTVKRIIGLPGPKILNVVTKKGLGYRPSFENPIKFHGIGSFDIETGKTKGTGVKSCSEIFGETAVALRMKDERIVAITAAMGYGTGLTEFGARFPKSYYDVGIEEEHAVTFAGGMAVKGMVPFIAIYSTFLQRSFDMIIHDIAIQNLPVRFFLDRGGIVGDDGETHHGVFDLSYLRMIPNVSIIAPSNSLMLQRAVYTAYKYDKGPIAVRYPRGPLPGEILEDGRELEVLPFGKCEVLRGDPGYDVLIIAAGKMTSFSGGLAAHLESEGLKTALIDAVWVKPVDAATIRFMAEKAKCVVTVEDNSIIGGFGDGVACVLASIPVPLIKIGWPDEFIPHGTFEELCGKFGITNENILNKIKEAIK